MPENNYSDIQKAIFRLNRYKPISDVLAPVVPLNDPTSVLNQGLKKLDPAVTEAVKKLEEIYGAGDMEALKYQIENFKLAVNEHTSTRYNELASGQDVAQESWDAGFDAASKDLRNASPGLVPDPAKDAAAKQILETLAANMKKNIQGKLAEEKENLKRLLEAQANDALFNSVAPTGRKWICVSELEQDARSAASLTAGGLLETLKPGLYKHPAYEPHVYMDDKGECTLSPDDSTPSGAAALVAMAVEGSGANHLTINHRIGANGENSVKVDFIKEMIAQAKARNVTVELHDSVRTSLIAKGDGDKYNELAAAVAKVNKHVLAGRINSNESLLDQRDAAIAKSQGDCLADVTAATAQVMDNTMTDDQKIAVLQRQEEALRKWTNILKHEVAIDHKGSFPKNLHNKLNELRDAISYQNNDLSQRLIVPPSPGTPSPGAAPAAPLNANQQAIKRVHQNMDRSNAGFAEITQAVAPAAAAPRPSS